MRGHSLNCQGSILIEGCFILVAVFLVFIMELELIRRIGLGTFLQYSAFMSAREATLGIPSIPRDINHKTLILDIFPFLGEKRSSLFHRFVNVNRSPTGGIVTAKYRARYRAYLQIFDEGIKKKYFEVTEACRFPFLFR